MMKKLLLLLITSWIGLSAIGQTIYQPSGALSFTGGNTYCTGAALAPLKFAYSTCSSGVGPASGASCQVTWYYNPINSTAITGATTAVTSAIFFGSATTATDTLTYVPTVTTGGDYYYFCVVTWAGGTSACGGATGTLVSGTQLVSLQPGTIAPASPSYCLGAYAVMTNPNPGGTWSIDSSSVATINPTTGYLITAAVGGANITYTLGACQTTTHVSVMDTPHYMLHVPSDAICVGATTVATDSTSGGVWSSSAPAVANIDTTSGLILGFSAGTTTISYTILSTGCYTSHTFTVNPNPAPIAGTLNVCQSGGVTTLTNTTSSGTWVSSNTSRAIVGATTGVVTGLTIGTVDISYRLAATGCFAIANVTVNQLPSAISGPNTVCAGNTITLANTVAGGSWSSSNTARATVSATGVVTGVTAGSVTISYTTPGCTAAVKTITVSPSPSPITGIFGTCYGQTTLLADATSGGTWTSSDTSVARVDTLTGLVHAGNMGTTTISYRISTGCYSSVVVTVNPLAEITGSDSVCVGSTIAMANIVGGGTWVSSNPAVASIDTFTGVVEGLLTGITYVGYLLPSGCRDTFLLHIIPSLPPIGGPLEICSGAEVTLSSGVTGGRWHSTNPFVAQVDSVTGAFQGHFPDTAIVSYTIYGCLATAIVTVDPLPVATVSYNWSTNTLNTAPTFAAYQWYDSVTGPISGATNASFVVPSGAWAKYAVVVTDANGCSARTAWFLFNVGVNDVEHDGDVMMYPNPANTVVNIVANNARNARVVVTGIDGKVLMDRAAQQLDVTGLPGGMYFVRVYDSEGILIGNKKLLVQH